ncbi:amino acid adenylation domain-containing protein [Streptomyces sp. NPDC006385]|uniref:amino acid adenylation domain-containing protein n=1 Tax=Streptomyces sp. NPDC006385 TaxID=3156761 RepID=UPI0033BE4BEE
MTAEAPPPELPTTDVFRAWTPDAGPAHPGSRRLILDRERWTAVRERAGRYGATSPDAVCTAFTDVIGAWSRNADFTVRRDDAPRGAIVPDTDPVAPFDTRLAAAARRTDLTGHGSPVAYAFGTAPREDDGELLIGCHAEESPDGALRVTWHVRETAFAGGTVDAMFTAFERRVRALADTDEAWESTAGVPLPPEQETCRAQRNATRRPLPEALLHEGVVAQCRRTPRAPAVIAADAVLSYAELHARASAVAAHLRARPKGPGRIVAVALDKSTAQIAAVLGVLMAGAAYLPLDPAQPAARRDRILADAAVRHVLVPDAAAGAGAWPEGVTAVPVDGLSDGEAPVEASAAHPDDLAYVIYTSGSTGVPKGVMISHRAALNTVEDINRRFEVGADDRMLGLASLGFDLSVYDIFGLLAVGGALVLPDPGRRADPAHWADLVARHRITLWNSVPAQLGLLTDHLESEGSGAAAASLRLALMSGDWIPLSLPDRIRALVPGLRLNSLGGATEAAIWSIWYAIGEVPPHWPSIPYGIPLDNQSWHVLDDHLRPRPDGVVGELYIGGAGLAMGYLGDPEKTAHRFVRHPETGERLYRTGDLGRYHPDGVLELLGREDRQVKIRGHRVEPAEVEAALLAHPAVKDAAVTAHPDASGGLRLAAYYVVGTEAGTAQLREHLGAQLPAYMVPSTFTPLDRLPLTANGKVDRAALPDPAATAGTGTAGAEQDQEPVTEAERVLAEIWAAVLEVETVRPADDFFELGGHSLLATQVVAELRERLGVKVPLRLMFEETTLRGFGAVVAAKAAQRDGHEVTGGVR